MLNYYAVSQIKWKDGIKFKIEHVNPIITFIKRKKLQDVTYEVFVCLSIDVQVFQVCVHKNLPGEFLFTRMYSKHKSMQRIRTLKLHKILVLTGSYIKDCMYDNWLKAFWSIESIVCCKCL